MRARRVEEAREPRIVGAGEREPDPVALRLEVGVHREQRRGAAFHPRERVHRHARLTVGLEVALHLDHRPGRLGEAVRQRQALGAAREHPAAVEPDHRLGRHVVIPEQRLDGLVRALAEAHPEHGAEDRGSRLVGHLPGRPLAEGAGAAVLDHATVHAHQLVHRRARLARRVDGGGEPIAHRRVAGAEPVLHVGARRLARPPPAAEALHRRRQRRLEARGRRRLAHPERRVEESVVRRRLDALALHRRRRRARGVRGLPAGAPRGEREAEERGLGRGSHGAGAYEAADDDFPPLVLGRLRAPAR